MIRKNNQEEVFTTRQQPLIYFKNIIDNNLINEKDNKFHKIYFECKELYGPFESDQIFNNTLFKLRNTSFEYDTDGLILVDNYEINKKS